MSRRVLLVPKIDDTNFLVCYLLSLFYLIKTFEIKLYFPLFKLAKKRIELVDLEEYFSLEEIIVSKAKVVKVWENILQYFSEEGWEVHLRGHEINMAKKAKQELQLDLEKFYFTQNFLQKMKIAGKKIINVDSLSYRFLKKIDKNEVLFFERPPFFLSNLNVFLDILNLTLLNIFLVLRGISQLIYGLLCWPKRKTKEDNFLNIKYIWDGISPRELDIDKNKNTFSWIVDDKVISSDQVFFLLPKPDFQMKHFSISDVEKEKFLFSNYFEIGGFASPSILLSCLFEVVGLIMKRIVFPRFTLKEILKTKYIIQTLKWAPAVEYLKPKAYITSVSCVGHEEPGILYFQEIGLKTVIWFYSTNSYFFTERDTSCDFRNILFCGILSSVAVVWNEHFKEFVMSHPQNELECRVIGPIMTGDERVIKADAHTLRRKLGFVDSKERNIKYIAIFDTTPTSRRIKRMRSVCLDPDMDEYNDVFIKNVYNLLTDFPNLFLIYKPKRSLTSGKFNYSPQFKTVLDKMMKNPRVIILDYNVNPWLPVAVADMAISLPFGSPTIAFLHYRKPALFYDPLNIAKHHRYKITPMVIVDSYEELRSKVKSWLFKDQGKRLFSDKRIAKIAGTSETANSSEKFREYLASIVANDEG